MPHLPTSNELSSSTPPSKPSPDAQVLEFRRPDSEHHALRTSHEGHGTGQDLEPLRLQVTMIIDAILADTGPEEAEVREKLRWHVANHPGQPEKALLKHLLNLSVQKEESA